MHHTFNHNNIYILSVYIILTQRMDKQLVGISFSFFTIWLLQKRRAKIERNKSLRMAQGMTLHRPTQRLLSDRI